MNKKTFTKAMLTGLLIFLPLFVFAVFYLNPKAGAVAIATLLVALFFIVFCLVALIGYLFRIRVTNNELLYESIRTSLRQGLLAGLYTIGLLGLAAIKLLTWWDALLLGLSLVLFELYFKSSRRVNNE